MPRLSLAQIASIAARLGHRDLAVVPRGASWVATCSCGYVSVRRRTDVIAAGAAAHHLQVVTRAFLASGKTLPDTPEGEHRFESRTSSVA